MFHHVMKRPMISVSWEEGNMDDLSLEHIQELRHAFTLCDKDGDGVITIRELGVLMGRLGQNCRESELKEMVYQIHPDGLSSTSMPEKEFGLSFDDFLSIMFYSLRGARELGDEDHVKENMLKETFRLFDNDGDGYITAPELRMLMSSLGEELHDREIQEMIKAVDIDGDGKVNYTEFCRMMLFK